MALSVRSKGPNKQEYLKDKKENSKQQIQTLVSGAASTAVQESKMLAELEKLRKENPEGHNQIRQ